MTAASKRNYKKEYANYHSKPEQRAKRSKRTVDGRKFSPKGDGKDVHHKNGSLSKSKRTKKDVALKSPSKNRSFKRTKKAHKVDKNA